MGRSIDQDVHAAFVEFRAKEDDKCLSVQCIYCQQIRAKNTSRQKQHLLECPGLQNHPSAHRPVPSTENGLPPNGYGQSAATLESPPSNMTANPIPNGVNGTPTSTFPSRPLPAPQPPPQSQPPPPPPPPPPPQQQQQQQQQQQPQSSTQSSTPVPRSTPKQLPKPTPSSVTKTPTTASGTLPPPPLEDVHQSFVEFRAKEEDKCLSVQCIYCNQIRAKNTSRQRQHLLECPTYLNMMKDSIPANNLLYRFEEGDIARSVSIPTPELELDFRMSIKLNPRVPVGPGPYGQRQWLSYIGGQWAGRWGKGIIIPGGQDNQLVVLKDLSTKMDATYLIQTSDDPPAFITVRTKGWWTGTRETLEKMQDPEHADAIAASQYKWRVNVELETGDERYQALNTAMWIGSGCKRGHEVIYDAYKIA